MLARAAALAEIARLKRTLATSALAESADSTAPETIVHAWRERRDAALQRYDHLLADLRASGGASLAVLLVVVREIAVLERA
jgi:glutamate dehydrogenase